MSSDKMDKRCPRKLDKLPDSWCPLAVVRLKALRQAGTDLTEEEENKLPGCPWAVNHQMANYCFFKLIAQHMPITRRLSDVEIAHYCSISTDTVNSIDKSVIEKLRSMSEFKELDTKARDKQDGV